MVFRALAENGRGIHRCLVSMSAWDSRGNKLKAKTSCDTLRFNYLSLDSAGYWQMRKVLELEPTAYNFPFG